MFNFDEERYLRIQRGAVAAGRALHGAAGDLLDAGAANVFFAGSGGAGILMQPAAQLLATRSTFPVHVVSPAELVLTGSAQLGPRSIVVIPSLSGTTRESIEVLDYVKSRGAKVIALTGHASTPVADGADVSLVNFAEDDTSCESFYLQSLLFALGVLERRGEFARSAEVAAELGRLPELLVEAKRAAEGRMAEFAATIADEPYHIITSAGLTWPEAHYYGMCILEEMQWIRTRPVHAADFFHGTLELVEPGVSVLLCKGEDELRPLTDRVEKFARTYTDKLAVFDSADYPLPGVSADGRALASPIVLAAVFERLSAHLEVLRDHPLTTRRYYKRVAY